MGKRLYFFPSSVDLTTKHSTTVYVGGRDSVRNDRDEDVQSQPDVCPNCMRNETLRYDDRIIRCERCGYFKYCGNVL